MPMLTTSVNLPPSVAAIAPDAHAVGEGAPCGPAPRRPRASRPCRRPGSACRRGCAARYAAPRRCSVVLILAPVNIRSRRSGTPRSSASWISSVSAWASRSVLEKSSSMSPSRTENSAEAVRVAVEERGDARASRAALPASRQRLPDRRPSRSPPELAGGAREPLDLVPAARLRAAPPRPPRSRRRRARSAAPGSRGAFVGVTPPVGQKCICGSGPAKALSAGAPPLASAGKELADVVAALEHAHRLADGGDAAEERQLLLLAGRDQRVGDARRYPEERARRLGVAHVLRA